MFGFIPGPQACCAKSAACYRAHFCGLCNVLRQEYGLWSRWLINRDSTLITLLGHGLSSTHAPTTLTTCCNPLAAPRGLYQDHLAARYAAAVTICGLTAKLEDDAEDERGWRKTLAAGGLKLVDTASTNALGLLHAMSFPVQAVTAALRSESRDGDLQAAAGPTRFAYGEIMAHVAALTDTQSAEKPLRVIGNELGFMIYARDAWDDWEADRRRGRFNPLSHWATQEQRRAQLLPLVQRSAATLREAFEALPLNRYRDLLHSVLVDGVDRRVTEWFSLPPTPDQQRAEDAKKKKRRLFDRKRSDDRCCDYCDCCFDCGDCCRCCNSTRCRAPRGGSQCCDCNPCDGDGCDCCGCDCT